MCSCVYAQQTTVYAGGVNGLTSMLEPKNSTRYRKHNGGLYLHNNGWFELSHQQRLNMLDVFKDKPISIEVGFPRDGQFGFSPDISKHHWWCDNFRDLYVNYGIKPDIVALNIDENAPLPTFDDYKRHHTDIKNMSSVSLVLPIVGHMNVQRPIVASRISNNDDYQKMIGLSGGLVLDVPPGNFLQRESDYKEWVIDAIRYTNSKGYVSVLIISPHDSKEKFRTHTFYMLNILRSQNAMPTVYVVENYIYDSWWQQKHGKKYYNKIGKESDPHSVLGVAKYILAN
jgi:hypothetical protein